MAFPNPAQLLYQEIHTGVMPFGAGSVQVASPALHGSLGRWLGVLLHRPSRIPRSSAGSGAGSELQHTS